MKNPARLCVLALLCCVFPVVLPYAPAQLASTPAKPASATASEQRTERVFAALKKNPPALQAWLRRMPKGADLHVHLSGEVYAETFLREAASDHLCVDTASMSLVANTGLTKSQPPHAVCAKGQTSAENAVADQKLYDQLINAFSMRSFVPSNGWSGHDQFFATFARFGMVDNEKNAGEWLDEVASRAASQNEQYMEIMQTPTFSKSAGLGMKLGWPAGAEQNISAAQLAALRDQLLAGGLRDEIAVDRKELSNETEDFHQREHCGQSNAGAACTMQIRWIYQVLRGFPPAQVYAQTLLGFEVASADPTVVGINFVMPEDGRISMRDYHLQMQMLDYLHAVYPKVHISLHAGEITAGFVPPDGLKFHITEAVHLGHAERIGHGVDVMYENNAAGLLKEMADKHIMVEINLTSNDGILGVKAPNHPLPSYRAAHVPVALSTDDEGVSRIDMTHEYTRAALEYDLTYRELKNMARTSLEHTFLPGESLWARRDDFTAMRSGCRAPDAQGKATGACADLLKSSEHAAQQWELERRFAAFEAEVH